MRSQEDRDSITLNIATSLLIFVTISAAGAMLLFLGVRTIGDGTPLGALGYLVFACAAATSLLYLWRHRRP